MYNFCQTVHELLSKQHYKKLCLQALKKRVSFFWMFKTRLCALLTKALPKFELYISQKSYARGGI